MHWRKYVWRFRVENAGVGREGDEEHIWILPPYPTEKAWFAFDILNGPHR
jgi:hypothetical protein